MLTRLRSMIAVLAIAAVAAAGLVLCPCAAPAEGESHDCCENGWRAAADSCCGADADTPQIAVALSNDAAIGASLPVMIVPVTRAWDPARSIPAAAPLSPHLPQTILRI